MNATDVVPALDLERFEVSVERGFLNPNPAEHLPKEFVPLDELALALPRLTAKGASYLRQELDSFPMLDVRALEGRELRRALMIAKFAASAYVKIEPEAKHIPAPLSHIIYVLSFKESQASCYEEQPIFKPPILSYDSYCLNNWRLKNPAGPFEIENLETLINFSFVPDEPGFILPHTCIEQRAGKGLFSIGKAQLAVYNHDPIYVASHVWDIVSAFDAMYAQLNKLPAWCNPDIYYQKVRPWIQKFDDVVYEGVFDFGGRPQSSRGETGAQSSVIPAFLAALGIEHKKNELTKHLQDMLRYMPPRHRQCIAAIKSGPSIREYILENYVWYRGLRDAYNAALAALIRFRKKHLEFAHSYITERAAGDTGTGGTPFEFWLQELIRETEEYFIP